MYLALIPDEQTTKALRAFAPALPSDAHCTVIHSKASLPAGLPLPAWTTASDIRAAVAGVELFGAFRKVRVLKLKNNTYLAHLREAAKQLLCDQQPVVLASMEWAFSPHVTLGGANAQLVGEPPAVLRFDRMEWRP